MFRNLHDQALVDFKKFAGVIFHVAIGWFLLQLRRERIAERMKALQELVPNSNKVLFFSAFNYQLCFLHIY